MEDEYRDRMLCLLFVVQEGNDTSKSFSFQRWKLLKSFALLPSVVKSNSTICKLFTRQTNIQLLDDKECPTLQAAMLQGQVEILKVFLLNGAVASTSESTTLACLQISVESTNEYIAERIFGRNPIRDVNTLVSSGRMKDCTPLHLAAEEGHTIAVKYLLDLGADINALNHEGQSVLCKAVAKKHLETVRCILRYHPNLDCKSSKKALEKLVLDEEKDIESEDIVKLLVQAGFTVCAEDVSNLMLRLQAVCKNYHYVVKMLLEQGLRANEVFSGDDRTFKYWRKNVFRKCCSETSLLHTAAKSCGKSMIQLLIDHGANVNLRCGCEENCCNITPLAVAVKYSNLKGVKCLLENGAAVQIDEIQPAYTVNSLFIEAVSKGYLKVVRALLNLGANVNASSYDTPALYLASEHWECDLVKLLIANNANLEIKNIAGKTALIRAAEEGHQAVVNLLLVFGAHVDFDAFYVGVKRHCLFLVIVSGQYPIFEALLDAFFQNPQFFAKTAVWEMFSPLYSIGQMYQLWNFMECCKIFERHLIKIKAAFLNFNDKNIDLMWHLDDADDFRSDCEAEIARMKSLNIGDTCATFYDILTKDVHQLASYARNDIILQMLKSNDYKKQFPIYTSIIEFQVKKGIQRRELLDKGLKICRQLFSKFQSLPFEVRERIVNYLTDQNLLVLEYSVTGSVY